MEEVEVAPPQKMEVRVKILFTALCHTDVYFWEAKGQTPVFPRIFELWRVWVRDVTELQPGDHVLPVFTGECKDCRHCKSPESNMCDLLRINTDRGVMLNDNQSSCGVSTGLGAALNVAKPAKGSTVAIFGLGAVGLAAAEGCRIAGASRIIGIDLNANRFDQGEFINLIYKFPSSQACFYLLIVDDGSNFFASTAKKFGCTEFVNPKDHNKPIQEVIAEMTDGGVDRSIECTGNVNAMISAFECVHDGWGVAVLVGVPSKDDAFKTHPMNLLNERTLKGTFYGNYKPRSDIPSVVEKYMNKELELDKFITHEVTFAEINKAFQYMLRGESLRCIIRMEI
ncbi:hypothetical protein HYC85_007983 [Camellia sinensis]|uniref:Alcohol dehydrogenase 1 n=1 Tax=Camellia sinensis TaxID=4442 RepID=A0A7J7HRY1_CAMSI|nr:hypothetical protein HYC85_007983 [Camellia sinensis]